MVDTTDENVLYPDPHLRRRTVLVVVLNNQEDFERAAVDGWYRIPQRYAPRRIGADYLAFYQTGAFGEAPESLTISYGAPVRRYHLMTRAEILPDEPDHPRAEEYYYRIEIGPLFRFDRPIPSARYRRVTFIHTTYDRLTTARDVTDLRRSGDPFETLWQALRESRLQPLTNRLAGEWPVDLALRVQEGYLGIRCLEEDAEPVRDGTGPRRWTMIYLSNRQIEGDLSGCLRRIGAALVALGGSLDTAPGTDSIRGL